MKKTVLVLTAVLAGGCTFFAEKRADDELRDRILTALNQDTMARQLMGQITISVHAGRVGVSGHVAGEPQRLRIMKIVRAVEGVTEAIDSLQVDDGMRIGGGGMYAY